MQATPSYSPIPASPGNVKRAADLPEERPGKRARLDERSRADESGFTNAKPVQQSSGGVRSSVPVLRGDGVTHVLRNLILQQR